MLGPESLVFTKDPGAGRIFVQPTDLGFEFGVIVDRADQTPTYSFALSTGGLEPSIAADGQTVTLSTVTHSEATNVLTAVGGLSAPVVLDASEVPAPASAIGVSLYRPGTDPVPPASVSPAALASLGADEVIVSYAIDAAWLAEPGRAFPIVVDPRACIGQGASGCDINDTSGNFDHFIESGVPGSPPTGWNVIRTGYDVRSDDGVTYNKMRSLLYFSPVTLPDGAVLYDADLKLHISSEYGGPSGNTMYAYRANKTWTTSTTWNGFPIGGDGDAYSTTGSASLSVPASGPMNFDVDQIASAFYTRRAKDWKPGYGFVLKMGSETTGVGEVEFDRWNDANTTYRPLLELDYTLPKVAIDFDTGLGLNYAPSTMIVNQTIKVPVIVTNKTGSGHVLDKCTTDGDCWQVGYRWFDEKGNLVAGGNPALNANLPADVAVGAHSNPFVLSVAAPGSVGQYTLRLDLVHYANYASTYYGWASDWATPSKFYSRNKKVLTSDNTRWVGSSAIERDEFSVNVVAGGGAVGETETVATGDGGSLGINLYSKNLAYSDTTGLGFADRTGLDVRYGYNSADTGSCTGYQGILGACGWYTNFDERIIGGANQTGYDYTYQAPDGGRSMIDTDPDGQLVGGASVLLNRPRVTILDENGGYDGGDADSLPDVPAVLASAEGFAAYSGAYVGKAASNTTYGLFFPDKFDLNTYHTLRFAMRTSVATKAGLCLKIHNVSDASIADNWLCYTTGATWTTGFQQINLGGTILNNWATYSQDLYSDVRLNGNFGSATDDYQLIGVQVQSSSGSNTGYTYLDAARLEPIESSLLDEANPANWTTGQSLTSLVTPGSGDPAPSGSNVINIGPASLATSPTCQMSACFAGGGLWSYAFAHWYWRKAGGQTAAFVFWFKDTRSGAPCSASACSLTYYAGAVPPAGATNPIQVSPHTPTEWTLVRRNILEDARTVLGFYDDAGSAGPDDVSFTGFGPAAIDGASLQIDAFSFGTQADPGSIDPTGADPASGAAGENGHPVNGTDTTFLYDFSADYPDGSRHYFNRDGLLERIRDRDGKLIDLDWTYDTTKAGPTAYTLVAVHAPSDGATSGGTTFNRQFSVSPGTDGASLATIRFDEDLGSTSSDSSSRAAIFEVATTAGTGFGVGDLVKVSPARHVVGSGATGTFCGSPPSGCVELSYTDSTNHRLAFVADPRWGGTTGGPSEYRWGIDRDGSNYPTTIRDMSHGTGGTPLLRVLTWSDVRDTGLLYTRPLWQDAAAGAAKATRAADLSPDGRALTAYAPRSCAPDCTSSTNWPATASQANYRASANEFDGLARITTSTTYRCPASSTAVSGCTGSTGLVSETRQGSNAGAKVDNYNDPLAAAEVPWTQSADQFFASLRDSAGANPDLYRTESLYDGRHQLAEQREPRQLETSTYPAAVLTSSPTAYWRLDENSGAAHAADATGAHQGDYAGSPSLGSTTTALIRATGTAMTLGSVSQFVSVPSYSWSGSYSVEAWINPANTTATMAWAGSRGGADKSFDIKLCTDATACPGGGLIRLDIGNGSVWLANANVPFVWQANRWYDTVVTVDGSASVATVYIDGQAIGTVALAAGTPLLSDGTRVLKIGHNGLATPGEPFTGSLDEVALYQTALSAADVADHFRAGRATATIDTIARHDNRGRLTESVAQFAANGGFEDGWNGWTHSAGASIVPGSANSGAANAAFGAGQSISQIAQLVAGQAVRFQYYGKSTSGAPVTATVEAWDPAGGGSWVSQLSASFADSSWTGHAWDLPLPSTTDGRVRVTFTHNQAGATGSIDDVVLATSWAKTDYNTASPSDVGYGLPADTLALRPGCTSCSGTGSTIMTSLGYAAGTTSPNLYPAIFPTSVIANWLDGSQGPNPDEDVTSTSTYDSWGRPLVATDPDGVTATTHYGANQTDVDYTADGLGKQTAFTYDAVGNRLSVTTPKSETTTTVYDALNHPVTVTAPAPIATVHKSIYTDYGQTQAVIANDVNDTPSGATGLDDLVSYTEYDALGNPTALTTDTTKDGAGFTGAIKARTETTYDLTGSVVATTQFTDTAWTAGLARTTTNHFETYAPSSGPYSGLTFTRLGASGVELPTGAPSGGHLCPDSPSAHCNSVATLDLSGQTNATFDGYNNQTKLALDLAGRTVASTLDWVSGGAHGSGNDQNLVTTTVYDIAGHPITVTDPASRSVLTTYDALGRPTLVSRKDSAGAPDTDAMTVYLPSGRVDRLSTVDHAGTDASLRAGWTKTVYDAAGRATKTLAHYDTSGAAQILTDNFEDGLTTSGQVWTNGSAGVHTAAGGSSAAELGVASPMSGEGRLRVTTGTGTNTGSEWVLPGTFKSGHTYRARVYVNAPSGTTVTLKLGTSADNSGSGTSVAGNGAWQGSSLVSWTPSADRTSGVALAAIRTASGSAVTFYLDDVVVWDQGSPDMNIPTESVYDDDGHIVRSIVVPGDPASEASLVTRTDYDVLGRPNAVIVNDIAGSGGTGSTTFTPTDDAHVKSANPTNNYGTLTTLQVRYDPGTPNDYKPYLKFSVSGLSGTVTDVKLRLNNTASSTNSGRDVCVYAVSDTSWAEGTITWATAPATGASLACVHGTQAAGWIDYDLGAAFTGNGTYAYAVFQTTATSVIYSSKEGANAPQLVVTTSSAPSDATTSLATTTTYDALGRADSSTNPKGVMTKTGYDRLGRPTAVWLNYVDGTPTDGTSVDDDAESTFAYDTAGDQTGFCPAAQVLAGGCDPASTSNAQAWHYVFDKAGRLTKAIPPVNTTQTALDTAEAVYEPGGYLDKTCTYPAGGSCSSTAGTHWTDVTNDLLGRATVTTVKDRTSGSDVTVLTTTTAYNLDGSPASVTDGADTLTYTYDASGRLDQLKRGGTVLTDYDYGGDGLVSARQDGNLAKPATAITYDWAKRPITVPLSSSIASGSIAYTYRLDGLLKTKALPGSTETATLAYDAARRPSAISFSVAGSSAISQTYDRAGNVTSEGRNLANATAINGDSKSGTLSYTYDGLNRLTGSTGSGGTRVYRYDLDGNRVYKSDPARTLTYTFDRTDEQINETNGSSTAFVYDPFGNLTKKAEDDLSQTTLAYDAANRMTGVTPASGSSETFTFDALSRNKTRIVGSSTTDTYGYLGPTETVYEVATSGGTTRTIDAALGPDGSRNAVKDASSFGWTLFDLHGDLAGLENSAMTAVTDANRYDGYGVTIDTDGSFGSPWKFQGALDVAPGSEPLYDIGARDYAPSLGSWTSLDSMMGSAQNPLSMNRFAYAEANPATLIDPTGHYAVVGDAVCPSCTPDDKPVSGQSPSNTNYKPINKKPTNPNLPGDDYDLYSHPKSASGGAAPVNGTPPVVKVSIDGLRWDLGRGCTATDPCVPELACMPGVPACMAMGFTAPVSSFRCDSRCQVEYAKATAVLVATTLGSWFGGEVALPVLLGSAANPQEVEEVIGSSGSQLLTPGQQTIEEIIRPGGQLIGQAGSSPQIRELPGGMDEARRMFDLLSKGGESVAKPGLRVQLTRLEDGAWITFRESSKSGPPTVDINVPGEPLIKLKFLP